MDLGYSGLEYMGYEDIRKKFLDSIADSDIREMYRDETGKYIQLNIGNELNGVFSKGYAYYELIKKGYRLIQIEVVKPLELNSNSMKFDGSIERDSCSLLYPLIAFNSGLAIPVTDTEREFISYFVENMYSFDTEGSDNWYREDGRVELEDIGDYTPLDEEDIDGQEEYREYENDFDREFNSIYSDGGEDSDSLYDDLDTVWKDESDESKEPEYSFGELDSDLDRSSDSSYDGLDDMWKDESKGKEDGYFLECSIEELDRILDSVDEDGEVLNIQLEESDGKRLTSGDLEELYRDYYSTYNQQEGHGDLEWGSDREREEEEEYKVGYEEDTFEDEPLEVNEYEEDYEEDEDFEDEPLEVNEYEEDYEEDTDNEYSEQENLYEEDKDFEDIKDTFEVKHPEGCTFIYSEDTDKKYSEQENLYEVPNNLDDLDGLDAEDYREDLVVGGSDGMESKVVHLDFIDTENGSKRKKKKKRKNKMKG